MSENALWYVVQTYSGYENAVLTTLNKHIENRNLQDQILDVRIPMEKVSEITETGEVKTTERKVFPGYVFIKMILTDETWHIVRNIRGVTTFTGFVEGASKGLPLTPEEVRTWGLEGDAPAEPEEAAPVSLIHAGDLVEIAEGPFSSYTGTVEEIDEEKNRIRIAILMGGRETPVDLSLSQVRPVTDD